MRMPEGPAPEVEFRWRAGEFAASLAGRSPHTRAAYEHDVDEFVAWAERGGCPRPAARSTTGRSAATSPTSTPAASPARRSPARPPRCRSYLRYLRRHGVIDHDPGALLRAPKGASAACHA